MPFTLPGHHMVQARWTRESTTAGYAGDVIINTFAFNTAASSDPAADIVARLDTFFFGTSTAANQSTPLTTWRNATLTGLTYYVRAADAPAGWPGEEHESPMYVHSNVQPAPHELALCTSYRAGPPYTKSRRGRVYIGGLAKAAIAASGLPEPLLVENLSRATMGLASESVTNPVQWVIASRTLNQAFDVVEGYVDQSWDVQRRRDPSTEAYGRHPNDWGTTGWML